MEFETFIAGVLVGLILAVVITNHRWKNYLESTGHMVDGKLIQGDIYTEEMLKNMRSDAEIVGRSKALQDLNEISSPW